MMSACVHEAPESRALESEFNLLLIVKSGLFSSSGLRLQPLLPKSDVNADVPS